MPETSDAPGLQQRKRGNGAVDWYWVARRDIVKRGFGPSTVRLSASEYPDHEARAAACRRLQARMLRWSADEKPPRAAFNGTMLSLIRLYQIEPTSPYHRVAHTTRVNYDGYLALLERTVGGRRIEQLTGADFQKWYDRFAEPAPPKKTGDPPGPPRVFRAHHAMNIVRGLMSFGRTMKLAGCKDAKEILEEMEFPAGAPRSQRPTFEQVVAIIQAAHRLGRPSVAIAQALQFDLCLRQYDVIGKWEPRRVGQTYPAGTRRDGWWGGVLWEEIDAEWKLTKATTKNSVQVAHNLKACDLAFVELSRVPLENRRGPVVVDERTGLPYARRAFYDAWRAAADAAGVPREVWNRDSRAGGVTEGKDAGADVRDLAKTAGHLDERTTEQVYLRDRLEASERVAEARRNRRKINKKPS